MALSMATTLNVDYGIHYSHSMYPRTVYHYLNYTVGMEWKARWVEFPPATVDAFISCFLNRTPRMNMEIDGIPWLVDLPSMVMLNLQNGGMKSIAWIDVTGQHCVPVNLRSFIGDLSILGLLTAPIRAAAKRTREIVAEGHHINYPSNIVQYRRRQVLPAVNQTPVPESSAEGRQARVLLPDLNLLPPDDYA